MTREEAIDILQEKHDECKAFYDLAAHPEDTYPSTTKYLYSLDMAIAALRPISREQVEKLWRGEWMYDPDTSYMYCEICKHTICQTDYLNGNPPPFCEMCGASMTDEAVQMVMERLEELHANR